MCGQDQGGTRAFACDSQEASAHAKPGLHPVKGKLSNPAGRDIIADSHPIEGTPTSQWDPDQVCWVCMCGRQGSLHSTQKIKILRFGNRKKKNTKETPTLLGIPQITDDVLLWQPEAELFSNRM